MDSNQLHELALNARLDHWPPHLGVKTEAEKIEYLAERLREAADAEARADHLADQLEESEKENSNLYDLQDEVKRLKQDLRLAQSKLEQIRDVL